MIKLATWNVNSINARLANVVDWLRTAAPDVVLLQELKCETDRFPAAAFEALGYHAAVHGQKTYNGVAILAKRPPADVLRGLPGDQGDAQARYIEATVGALRVASIYLPNGNPVASEKYPYKLAFMDRLKLRAQALLDSEQPFALGGDYNVIPEPIDCYDPTAWQHDALFQLDTRRKFRAIVHLGLTDAYRVLHPTAARAYSFWDYQAGCWPMDKGVRIDHVLLSPQAADRLVSATIDKEPRGRDKASDHTPVMVELDLAPDRQMSA